MPANVYLSNTFCGPVCCLLLFSFQGSSLLSLPARQARGLGRGEVAILVNQKQPVNTFLNTVILFTTRCRQLIRSICGPPGDRGKLLNQ